MIPLRTWLEQSGAQRDVIDGLASFGDDWEAMWKDCPRGDWMLGIAERLGVDHGALVRAAVGCAELALDYVVGDEARHVLRAAGYWVDGSATALEVKSVTDELEEATKRPADPSCEAGMRAAVAVGMGVEDRTVLPTAASAATEAAITASIDCGFEMAMRWAHDKCASAVRLAIPWSMVKPCIDRLGDPR
jgi:hypothetical protein